MSNKIAIKKGKLSIRYDFIISVTISREMGTQVINYLRKLA